VAISHTLRGLRINGGYYWPYSNFGGHTDNLHLFALQSENKVSQSLYSGWIESDQVGTVEPQTADCSKSWLCRWYNRTKPTPGVIHKVVSSAIRWRATELLPNTDTTKCTE